MLGEEVKLWSYPLCQFIFIHLLLITIILSANILLGCLFSHAWFTFFFRKVRGGLFNCIQILRRKVQCFIVIGVCLIVIEDHWTFSCRSLPPLNGVSSSVLVDNSEESLAANEQGSVLRQSTKHYCEICPLCVPLGSFIRAVITVWSVCTALGMAVRFVLMLRTWRCTVERYVYYAVVFSDAW